MVAEIVPRARGKAVGDLPPARAVESYIRMTFCFAVSVDVARQREAIGSGAGRTVIVFEDERERADVHNSDNAAIDAAGEAGEIARGIRGQAQHRCGGEVGRVVIVGVRRDLRRADIT